MHFGLALALPRACNIMPHFTYMPDFISKTYGLLKLKRDTETHKHSNKWGNDFGKL